MTNIELLEKWRDYFWRKSIWAEKNDRLQWSYVHAGRAMTLNLAIDILKGGLPPEECRDDLDLISEYNNYSYGEHPDSWKWATLDNKND